MGRVALILLPLGVALVALGLAAMILPACAVGVWPWASACPPAADAGAPDRQAALAARRAALEAEIAAAQRRIAALPACPQPVAAVEPEPEPEPIPAIEPTPRPERRSAPAAGIDEDRWRDRDVGLLEGCWNLDSDYTMVDGRTGQPRGVRRWRMCFDAQGRGQETQVFTDGATCRGPIRARFASGGALQIDEDDDVPCSDNSNILRRRTVCEIAGNGRAQCQNFHPSLPDSRRVPIILRR